MAKPLPVGEWSAKPWERPLLALIALLLGRGR